MVFFPRKTSMKAPRSQARDYIVEVEPGVSVGCRFYMNTPESASMLYFHGNGEMVDDYDREAQVFNGIGINLFVASFRGYGFGNGAPTLTNMIKDSHVIFEEFRKIAYEYGSANIPFIMGRSLGSLSAIELALHDYPGRPLARDHADGLVRAPARKAEFIHNRSAF